MTHDNVCWTKVHNKASTLANDKGATGGSNQGIWHGMDPNLTDPPLELHSPHAKTSSRGSRAGLLGQTFCPPKESSGLPSQVPLAPRAPPPGMINA